MDGAVDRRLVDGHFGGIGRLVAEEEVPASAAACLGF